MNFRTRNIPQDKEGYFRNIKGSTHQEDMANTVYTHTFNNRIQKYIKPKPTDERRNRKLNNYTWRF